MSRRRHYVDADIFVGVSANEMLLIWLLKKDCPDGKASCSLITRVYKCKPHHQWNSGQANTRQFEIVETIWGDLLGGGWAAGTVESSLQGAKPGERQGFKEKSCVRASLWGFEHVSSH